MGEPTTALLEPLSFRRGRPMRNRFVLAPLTNRQSHSDGVLSEEERRWLTMRATGGFGAVMTAAAYVQDNGKAFGGQLGVAHDDHLPGLTRLAEQVHAEGALAFTQLQHGGNRTTAELAGETPVAPSADERGARALTLDEVAGVRDAFIAAAVRSQQAGMDGTELHAAHGYLIAQFLSPEMNRRTDAYGGTVENRSRLLMEIIDGVRTACGEDFILGVRISPERFGIRTAEAVELARQLLVDPRIDFLDVSLWDTFKDPADPAYDGRSLAELFTDLPRDGVRLGFAGKLYSPGDVERAFALGPDFVMLGRGAVLMHDFPRRYANDPAFTPVAPPVSPAYLAAEGVSEPFVEYLRNWEGFVGD